MRSMKSQSLYLFDAHGELTQCCSFAHCEFNIVKAHVTKSFESKQTGMQQKRSQKTRRPTEKHSNQFDQIELSALCVMMQINISFADDSHRGQFKIRAHYGMNSE